MAPRRSAAAAAADPGAADSEPPVATLTFNEPLTWRPGKPIATADLLRRLDSLSHEMNDLKAHDVDKSSLTRVAKDLASQNLLNHKDRGVRAFAACCLVDILELSAPDAPFTGSQLKDIFTLIVTSIIPALADPSNAYNTQHMYVLSSLAECKSILLLTDIPNAEPLMLHLFTSVFDIVSGSASTSTGEQISKQVEFEMVRILVALIDEAASLPTQVIDIVVAQFLRAATPGATAAKGKPEDDKDDKQSTLLLKELPPAYKMAELVCNACADKMARYISQYFNDVIMDASAGTVNGHRKGDDSDDDDDDAHAGPTEADLKELRKAHLLLRELWRASPAVLQNVIPQLEAELSAENVQLRLLATETLGDIIAGIGAAGPPPSPAMDPAAYPPVTLDDYPKTPMSESVLTTPLSPQPFAQTYPSAYGNFLGRKNDKSALIRSAWTTAIGRIILTSAGGRLSEEDETQIVTGLAEKLTDADERVRISAVKSVGSFGFRDLVVKLGPSGGISKPGSIMANFADRCRDRKHAVQVEALTTICKMWGVAAGEIAAGNDQVIAMLGAIPSKVFDVYYANDQELNVLVDHVMFEQLIPLSYPPTKGKGKHANGDSQSANGDGSFDADKIRTARILLLIKSLDVKSKKAFFALQARQTAYCNVLKQFLTKCEEHNGGVMEKGAEKAIKEKLAAMISWLSALLPDKPRATADLWKYVKSHDRRTYQLIRFAMAPESDFKTVFRAIKEFSKRVEGASSAPAGLLETMTPLLYRASSLVYNRSNLPALLQFSKNDEHGLSETAHEVLKQISERNPEIFKSHVKELCKELEDLAPTKSTPNDHSVVPTLKTCAGYARKYPEEIPHDRRFIQALVSFAQFGAPPTAAKYAVTILMAASERREMHAKDLIQKSTQKWEYGAEHFLTKLAAISQLALMEPTLTEDASDDILDITTQQILLKSRSEPDVSDRGWADEEDDECQAKCWALRILVNRVRANTDPATARQHSAPVFKLLNSLIAKEGEILKDNNTPKAHRSRLRLLAAQLMLKLCRTKTYDDMFSPAAFNRLACVAQDTLYPVRRGFVETLQKYLVQEHLSHRFYAIVFLMAFEPEYEFRQVIMTWIRSRAKIFQDKKQINMEAVLPRLLSLLAHHPDFSTVDKDLVDHANYILFYLVNVANEENLGLIFKYAQRVKQVADGIAPDQSDHLYVMSDLAQSVIRGWEEKKGWSMQSYDGKLGMPAGLFTALPNHEVAMAIAQKNYLPPNMEHLLNSLIKNVERKHKRKTDEDGEPPHSKKPRSEGRSQAKGVRKKIKTPRPKKTYADDDRSSAVPESERRRSGRFSTAPKSRKSYADRDSDEDDEEMLDGVAEWEYLNEGDSSEAASDDDDDDVDMAGNDEGGDAEAEEQAEEAEQDEEAEEQAEEDDDDDEESHGRSRRMSKSAKGKERAEPTQVAVRSGRSSGRTRR